MGAGRDSDLRLSWRGKEGWRDAAGAGRRDAARERTGATRRGGLTRGLAAGAEHG